MLVAVIGVCCEAVSLGVLGTDDDKIALPSSESASNNSGGSRSFSMSDFRLHKVRLINNNQRGEQENARIVETVNRLFDVLRTGCEVAIGQLGGSSDALELRDFFGFLAAPRISQVKYSKEFATYRSNAKTRAIRPTAMILFLIAFRRAAASACAPAADRLANSSSSSSNSSLVHVLRTATSISVTKGVIITINIIFKETREGRTLFTNEWQTPGKHIHEVRQPVWMGCAIKLSNVHHIAFVFEDGGLVVVNVEIIWCRENGHDGGESSRLGLSIHAISAGN